MTFIVTSSPGLEELTHRELQDLGIEAHFKEMRGVLSFQGGWAELARVLTHIRTASKVLLSLREFSSKNRKMLYDQVRRIDWPSLFPSQLSFAVRVHGEFSEGLLNGALTIKDALCDEFRKRGHERPSVQRVKPDLEIVAFFKSEGRCELSLDLTGEPLSRRGYRAQGGGAPLREAKAAALLLFSGYRGEEPFVDPFCGSGTLAIEAALLAKSVGPGLLRHESTLTVWKLFPDARPFLLRARKEARLSAKVKKNCNIFAADNDPKVLKLAKENAQRAGVFGDIHFQLGDAQKIKILENSWVVTNPPYGERIKSKDEASQLLSSFTRHLKHSGTSCKLSLVVPRGPLEHAVGLRPKKKLSFENGPLPSRFLSYEIFPGKTRPSS